MADSWSRVGYAGARVISNWKLPQQFDLELMNLERVSLEFKRNGLKGQILFWKRSRVGVVHATVPSRSVISEDGVIGD